MERRRAPFYSTAIRNNNTRGTRLFRRYRTAAGRVLVRRKIARAAFVRPGEYGRASGVGAREYDVRFLVSRSVRWTFVARLEEIGSLRSKQKKKKKIMKRKEKKNEPD